MEGERRGGERSEGRRRKGRGGGHSGNVADQAFCLKSAPDPTCCGNVKRRLAARIFVTRSSDRLHQLTTLFTVDSRLNKSALSLRTAALSIDLGNAERRMEVADAIGRCRITTVSGDLSAEQSQLQFTRTSLLEVVQSTGRCGLRCRVWR